MLYLPQHVQFILGRAWFYMNGDDGTFPHQRLVKSVLQGATSGTATAAVGKVVKATAGVVRGEL